MVTKEEMQAAADAGELAGHRAVQVERDWQKVYAQLTDRRWIIGKVVEIAVTRTMSPAEFTAFCDNIARFMAQDTKAGAG